MSHPYYLQHSDEWYWQPPVPVRLWEGWYVTNDDGLPMDGPYKTKAEAKAEMQEKINDQ